MPSAPQQQEHQLEVWIGNMLRVGVILSAIVVFLGGVLLLGSEGQTTADYGVFQGVSRGLTSVNLILRNLFSGDPRVLIQFGVLLLISTPITRVIFSVFGFAQQKDWLYVGITLLVLALLLASLFS